VTGQPRDNNPSFMHVLCLPIHPSLRGRELPRPTRSTLVLPNTTDTDLGPRVSVQTTTGCRRALMTGRAILAPVGTTIATRVLIRGARPRAPLEPAVTPRLDAATACATLGAPRGIAIPGLVGSRGLLPTITGAGPTSTPSTGLLRPPKIVLLPLLVDVQESLELVVHDSTGPPLQDRLPRSGVPHRVRLRPGEQVCSGSCPQSQRGITPSENPAQDADRYPRVTTRTPGSLGAKRTKTTEATQTQRFFIRTRTMTPKHTLIYPQKQDAGRAQSRPPGAIMGGPVPNGPRSQARASSGPCPASLTALPLEGGPRPSRAVAGKSLRLPRFQDLPKTNTSGLIPRFFNFPG